LIAMAQVIIRNVLEAADRIAIGPSGARGARRPAARRSRLAPDHRTAAARSRSRAAVAPARDDCVDLVLAQTLDDTLVTADEAMLRVARARRIAARALGPSSAESL
jgi:hypothetical protein